MNEFSLIKKYLKPLSLNNRSALKLNDDIYYDSEKKIAISVDTFVEGVHFLDASDPKKFLKKILRASLSDLYCKGIKPNSYFLTFALNSKLAKPIWLKKINKILRSEQKKFHISLSGGDTTRSSNLVISIIVLGKVKNKPVLRRGSSINDDIYVTGNLADSFIGLNIIRKKFNFKKLNNFFKKKYYEPELQTEFSPYLYKIASTSIDISDGLAQDLQHLCNSSGFGASINLNLLPFSANTRYLINKKLVDIKNIFSKGDDYQILFTSKSKNRSKIIKISKKLRTKITRIGIVTKARTIIFNHNMKKIKISRKKMGYMHTF